MNRPIELLRKYYPPDGSTYRLLLAHSGSVALKARKIAESLTAAGQTVDITFVEEAALLHDIGILHTHAPEIGCHGDLPYICHGIKGREILEQEGLGRHALVCERHIGVGLTLADIQNQNLPLPHREMTPLSIEEEIVAYSDLFFSKDPAKSGREKRADRVRSKLQKFGEAKVRIFDDWHQRFSLLPG